jgi:hypothetical protein
MHLVRTVCMGRNDEQVKDIHLSQFSDGGPLIVILI